jgi:hypothetical protein
MQLLDDRDLQTPARAADGYRLPRQTSNDERRAGDLQIGPANRKKKQGAQRAEKEAGSMRI